MRLPFLQVSQETWAKARMLGGLLGISRREAIGLILDLWAWALDLGPPDKMPTGRMDGPRARQMLAAALEWSGDLDALIAALVDVGLLALEPEGLRVRGLDRYASAWKKAAKERRRKAAYRARRDGASDSDVPRMSRGTGRGQPRDGGRKTQTQTQTQRNIDPLPSEACAAPAAPPPPEPERPPLVLEEQDAALPPRALSPQEQLFAAMRLERAAAFPEQPPEQPKAARVNTLLKPVLEAVGPQTALAAYRGFLQDSWARALKPPCPLAAFAAPEQWTRHVELGAPAELRRAACAVCREPAEAAIAPGVPACYPHVGQFQAEMAAAERPWELAAAWVAERRASEVAA